MTKEEKDLLLKDLCARLPHNVTVLKRKPFGCVLSEEEKILEPEDIRDFIENEEVFVFPYLRPMSSMTEEEMEFMEELSEFKCTPDKALMKIDFYLKHHIDFRGLIPMGLALKAPENMYND